MVDMGAEVGQKMRSAIKAKLTELNCYVDDELPDYIMVMVANKRTKSQMNEDLNLFLKGRTSTFVDWLHMVLKKLKEVTVTNLDVYKKASKRKPTELPDAKINEKKIKKELSKSSKETQVKQEVKTHLDKCLTDDLPLNVNVKSLTENRKIVLFTENSQNNHDQSLNSSSIQDAELPRLQELEEIETQIRSVKSRLGLKIDQEVEESELQRIVENNKKSSKVDDILANGRQIVVEILKPGKETLSKEREGKKFIFEESDNDDHLPTKRKEHSKIVFSKERDDTLENCEESENDDHHTNKKREHSKIVFSREDFRKEEDREDWSSSTSPPKKKSVLDRLGHYGDRKNKSIMSRLGKYSYNKSRSSNSTIRDEDSNSEKRDSKVAFYKEKNVDMRERRDGSNRKNAKDLRSHSSKLISSIISKKDLNKRLGLSSKVTIPQIDPQLLEDTFKKREVVSVVKVKPRILPSNVQQANKNLLLKAVADAQKSIAQYKSVGRSSKNNAPSSNNSAPKYSENEEHVQKPKIRKVPQEGKKKLEQFLSNYSEEFSDQEYTSSAQRADDNLQYVPTSVDKQTEYYDTNIDKKQKFIVTLDGIQKSDIVARLSAKESLQGRKSPSPIIFDHTDTKPKIVRKIPDELPVVSTPPPKKKEKCKYFPSCKNGAKCEFFHPVKTAQICEQFPFCKFGDNCHYVHPKCKFGTSCTKRDCSYAHSNGYGARATVPVVPIKTQITKIQICKFLQNCMNINCSFQHPKPCKYGSYCKNQSVCNYVHTNFPSKNSLTWRSK